jgi:signal transduction histidine kinase
MTDAQAPDALRYDWCRSRRRLIALICLALAGAELLAFLPSLSQARRSWLEHGVAAAALAAPAEVPPHGVTVDFSHEGLADGVISAVAGLFPASERLLIVSATGWPRPETNVTAVLDAAAQTQALREHALWFGVATLPLAALGGLLLYAALYVSLVRPLRGLTNALTELYADPERRKFRGASRATPGTPALRVLQQELRTAQWRYARLAAMTAAMGRANHDLRGVLSPALLTAERLQMNADPAIKRAGDVLVRAVERAADVMRRAVEHAREYPSLPAKARIALRPAVEVAAEQARSAFPSLAVENAVPDDIEVEADQESVVRMIGNLFANAGDAGARRVRALAEVEGNELAITVTDDGPGLPPTIANDPFQPFAHTAGMGLAIVRELARAYGGTVGLLNTGVGGSSFRVTLAAAKVSPAQVRRVAAAGE